MRRIKPPYRSICGLALIVFGGVWLFEPSEDSSQRVIMAQAAELSVPKTAAVERFDFALQDLQGWRAERKDFSLSALVFADDEEFVV